MIVQVSVALGKKSHGWGSGLFIFGIARLEKLYCHWGGRLERGEAGCVNMGKAFRETAPRTLQERWGWTPLRPPHDPPSSSSWWAGGRSADVGGRKGCFWSPPWASCLSLLLPPFPFLSHSGSPTPAQACLALLAKQLRAAAVAVCRAPQAALPPRRGWIGRITPIPQPLSSPQGHREGIPFMIADVLPFAKLWALAPGYSGDSMQHLQTGPFPPLTGNLPH